MPQKGLLRCRNSPSNTGTTPSGSGSGSRASCWRNSSITGSGRLDGAPPTLDLPTDRPRPAVQTFRGALLPFDLPGDLVDGLRLLAEQEDCTLYMVLLAAFQALLHRYSGQDDLCVGTPIAGRGRTETEGLIGFFVNTLVMRGDLSGDPTFRSTCSAGCARPPWRPTSTRTCRSSASWRS